MTPDVTAPVDVEGLQRENERLLERLAETQMLAFKWMEAHDKLHAGKPYNFPKPADYPDSLAAHLATIKQLEQRVGELEGALEPFAVQGRQMPDSEKDYTPCRAGLVSNRAFRRAALASTTLSEEGR